MIAEITDETVDFVSDFLLLYEEFLKEFEPHAKGDIFHVNQARSSVECDSELAELLEAFRARREGEQLSSMQEEALARRKET